MHAPHRTYILECGDWFMRVLVVPRGKTRKEERVSFLSFMTDFPPTPLETVSRNLAAGMIMHARNNTEVWRLRRIAL